MQKNLTMPPEPLSSYWSDYQNAERDRVHSELTTALQRILEALRSSPVDQWQDWALELSRRVVDENDSFPVRLSLFRGALFPVLLSGMEKQRPGCARWMAGFANLLHRCPEEQSKLAAFGASEEALLRVALKHDPNDRLAMLRLVRCMGSDLEFAIHEVPADVVYGSRVAATIAECEELTGELRDFTDLVRRADVEEESRELIEECGFHFRAYSDYLQRKAEYRDYEDYLETTGCMK